MAIICLRALHRTKYLRWRRASSSSSRLAPLLFALLPMPDNDGSATTDGRPLWQRARVQGEFVRTSSVFSPLGKDATSGRATENGMERR